MNQRELSNVNLLTTPLSTRRHFRLHSAGLKRLTMNIPKLTQKYPAMMHIQRGIENGFRKENTPGFWISGFFIMMLIPLFIKGLVKAISSSRCFVIVRGATAKSAFWYKWKIKLFYTFNTLWPPCPPFIFIFFIFFIQFCIIKFKLKSDFSSKKEHIIKYFLSSRIK